MSRSPVFVVLAKEIRDASRNRWFLVISLLFAALAVTLSLFGLSGLGTFGISGFGRTAASLLNLVLIIVPLLGLLLGSISIAGEREQGTLLTLLAQPVTANEVFLGKYLGGAFALASSVLLGFGASGLVIARYSGPDQIGDYLVLVGFTVLLGLAFLSIGFCVSLFTRRHATAMGMAIFFWFAFLFLSDLGLMGTAMALKLSPANLFWLVAANPAQAFKLAVLGHLGKGLETFGASGLYASEIFGDWLWMGLGAAMMAWVLLPLAAAFLYFRARCVD